MGVVPPATPAVVLPFWTFLVGLCSKKGCELHLGAIVNKIEISNPKISLINYIDTPPNPTITSMLEITESGANIHLARKDTPTIAPVIMENDTEARLPDGFTTEFTHVATI